MIGLQQAYSFYQNLRIQTFFFFIKGEIIASLQDAGKSSNEKRRFTIRRIILITEDK